MQTAVFNDAQLEILRMMSFAKTNDVLIDIKQALSDYFANKAQQEIDRLWQVGELDEDKVNSFLNLHERTPYK